jgi:hypothetical protein
MLSPTSGKPPASHSDAVNFRSARVSTGGVISRKKERNVSRLVPWDRGANIEV